MTVDINLDREIGARLRVCRKRINMSQERLGALLGITFQQVQKYERGTNRISASSLIHIARALKCSPLDILGTDGEERKVDWSAMVENDTLQLVEAFKRLKPLPATRQAVIHMVTVIADTLAPKKRKSPLAVVAG